MTNPNSSAAEVDSDLNPELAVPRRSRNGIMKIGIVAAVVVGAVVMSTNAINSNYDEARLNAGLEAVAATRPAEILQLHQAPSAEITDVASQTQSTNVDGVAWRVQLVSLSKQQDTQRAWTSLRQANRDLLDGLELHVQLAELSQGTFYRVQAGPLADRSTAASLCISLKTRSQDCLVVAP